MPIGGVASVEGGAIGVPIGGVALIPPPSPALADGRAAGVPIGGVVLIPASSARGVWIMVDEPRDGDVALGDGGTFDEMKETRSEKAPLHSLPPSPAPDK